MTRNRDWDTAHTDRKVRAAHTNTKREVPAASQALSCRTHADFHRGRRQANSVRATQAMSLGNRKKVVSLAKVTILEGEPR